MVGEEGTLVLHTKLKEPPQNARHEGLEEE